MISAINYQLPMLVLGILARFAGNREDTKKAKSIAIEAKKLASEAKQENKHGEMAKSLSGKSADAKERQAFAAIAVWHYERSARKYAAATEKLDSVLHLDLSKRNANYLSSKRSEFARFSGETNRQAVQIQTTINQ